MRLRFNGRRVHANEAYKEYIQERHHIHMNSTVWETLTEFVHWLGQNNICKIDKTEKGWFVTYIDHNPWQIGKVNTLHCDGCKTSSGIVVNVMYTLSEKGGRKR